MWKYVSRRIKDTFERGAGYFDARSAAGAGAGTRDAQERRSAVPCRWRLEQRCWGGRAYGDDTNGQSYFNYLNQTWLGAITWSSALCLGWYASQLIHLRKKYHSRDQGPLCSIAVQLQKNLTAANLCCVKPVRAISEEVSEAKKTENENNVKGFVPVLVTNDHSGTATHSTASSSPNDLGDILNSIENKLGLAAIESGQHQDGLGMLRSAASRHHPPALYNLGLCYEMGLGVKPDEKMAMELYRSAAALQHPGALYNLAVYYGQGRGGLTCDLDTATRLLRIAAHKGQADAIHALEALELQEPKWEPERRSEEKELWNKYEPSATVLSPTSLFVEQIQALRGNVDCRPAVY